MSPKFTKLQVQEAFQKILTQGLYPSDCRVEYALGRTLRKAERVLMLEVSKDLNIARMKGPKNPIRSTLTPEQRKIYEAGYAAGYASGVAKARLS